MSAREELEEFVKRYGAGAGHAVAFPGLLDAYRDGVLREAAGKIHRMAYAMRSCDGTWDDEFSNEYVGDALGFAADLIASDKEN